MKKETSYLVIGGLVLAIAALLTWWNPLQTVQWKLSDLFFRGRGASDLITIIAIDEKSLSPESGMGRFRDWPRTRYAQLLKTITAHKPKVVAFDLDFKEKSRGMSDVRLQQLLREYEKRYAEGGSIDWYSQLKRFENEGQHPDDLEFAKAMTESGFPVVLASTLMGQTVVPPLYSGDNISSGFVNVELDRDGVLRRFVPFAQMEMGESIPSFATATTKAYLERGGNQAPVVNPSTPVKRTPQPILINYAGRQGTFRTLSFYDVLANQYEPEEIEGKIVLIGATALVVQDLRQTPTSKNPMSGVEINANIVQQILENKMLREQGSISLALILIICALGGSFIFSRLQLHYGVIIFAAFMLLYPLVAYGMYQIGIVMNVVYPQATWILAALGTLWYRNRTEFREKRAIKNAFAHYVSPVVVNELAKNPNALKLGGKRQEISVMFSDIVGFTTLAEKLSPEDTVALLNDYLTAMTEVIFGFQGTLDKYQGDAIMALFGAPVIDPHHAVNACASALEMRKALVTLHEKWNSIPDLPFKQELVHLDFRVGIATGPAVIGNVGSEKRFDYTAIGDIVNLGSRLESINRKYGTRVIIDRRTFTAITENHNPFVFRKLDMVRVKGKQEVTEIFEVVAPRELVTTELKGMLDDFENGRILYTQRNFGEAKQYFESALSRVKDDGPSQIYRNRCNFFMRKPPVREWDAVVNLEEK